MANNNKSEFQAELIGRCLFCALGGNMKLKIILMGVTLISFTQGALAQSEKKSCPDEMPQRFKTECEVSLEFNKADVEMKALLSQLLEKLRTKEAKDALVQAQEAWDKYVTQSCLYEKSAWLGGAELTINTISCEKRYTKKRVEALKEYATCGGNGCPE